MLPIVQQLDVGHSAVLVGFIDQDGATASIAGGRCVRDAPENCDALI